MLLVTEAGGIVTDFDCNPISSDFSLKGTVKMIVSANMSIYIEILKKLRK
jgi:fructose-1,6-bisphosphatase/inositol monophosphatase family enzyme